MATFLDTDVAVGADVRKALSFALQKARHEAQASLSTAPSCMLSSPMLHMIRQYLEWEVFRLACSPAGCAGWKHV
eukprot:5078243-Lingulodinium_polyedra.AAC.1